MWWHQSVARWWRGGRAFGAPQAPTLTGGVGRSPGVRVILEVSNVAAWIVCVFLVGGCASDKPCSADADCAGFERAVCQQGACVCEFDDAARCLCESQSRCDEVYGVGERYCVAGACRGCRDDADCGRLQRCGSDAECYLVECEGDDDCSVGVCNEATLDCIGCTAQAPCPTGWICRGDGACVACTADDQCAADSICDVDAQFRDVEIVATNQCGRDCGPTCHESCADDPQCRRRPACVVTDPACLPAGTCQTWDDCDLPESCELRLQTCGDGSPCEALALSFFEPIHFACLATPCLLDDECATAETCYEGRCLPACEAQTECSDGTCVARVHLQGGACLRGLEN